MLSTALLVFYLIFSISSCTSNDELPHEADWNDIYEDSNKIESRTFDTVPNTDSGKNQSSLKKNWTQTELCQRIIEDLSPTLQDLQKQLSKPAKDYPYFGLFSELSQLKKEDCLSKKTQKGALENLKNFMHPQNKKIGVLLPLTGPKKRLGTTLLSGINVAFTNYNKISNPGKAEANFLDIFIVKDTETSPEHIESSKLNGSVQKLAEMIFSQNIQFLLVSPRSEDELKSIATITKKLMLPTFLFFKDSASLVRSSFSYHFFPKEDHIALALAKGIQESKYKSISILKPTHGKANKLCQSLKKNLQELGIAVNEEIPYIAGQYASMNKAVAHLAGTDPKTRSKDYSDLSEQLKQEAQEKGTAFNQRLVLLNPQLKSSAVFIPDHFRNIRHFISIFRYHGVKELALVGNHEWRAKALIRPWDKFLSNAFFADYLGRYDKLPAGIEYTWEERPYWIPVQQAFDVDMQMTGYRAGYIAYQLLREPEASSRAQLAKKVRSFQTEPFLHPEEKSFDEERGLRWPVHLLHLTNSGGVDESIFRPE
ncbi:MAG: hypothetical protein KA436_09570 [Oligoflexales bacterium]|nr:hypothetical protein [Oligoflexales bacterium]